MRRAIRRLGGREKKSMGAAERSETDLTAWRDLIRYPPVNKLEGIQAPLIPEGAVDTLAFETYIKQGLAPSLSPGQIVILDNLSVHKGERVRQAIEARGCQVLFLPAYSPDLTPIEEAFSKLKAWLRRLGAWTREALERIPARDAHGWADSDAGRRADRDG